MFKHNFIACFVLICFISLTIGVTYKQAEIDCSLQRKCSTNADTVWATDGSQCYLFRNPCIFANEICIRRKKYQAELKIVTEQQCKQFCADFCTLEYAPVCGEYNNDFKTFSNMCDFYRYSCQNGECKYGDM